MTDDRHDEDRGRLSAEAGTPDDDHDQAPAYEIGYKRPPKASQFKPGQSGNRRGRPPGAKGFKTLIREGLGTSIDAKIDGKSRAVLMGNAILMRLFREGVAGNARAMQLCVSLMERYGLQEDEKPKPLLDLSKLTVEELTELSRLRAKMEGREEEHFAYLKREEEISALLARGKDEHLETYYHRLQSYLTSDDAKIREGAKVRLGDRLSSPRRAARRRYVEDDGEFDS